MNDSTTALYSVDEFEDKINFIAENFGISHKIITMVVIVIGTSLPELVTCVIAALKKQPDLAVGNIIGSNIFNMTFIIHN